MSAAEPIDPRPAPSTHAEKLGLYPVRSVFDRFVVRRAVREHARAIGFSRVDCAELVVVASELCSNVAKYGVKGSLEVDRLIEPRRGAGIRLCATDFGPPFVDFTRAVEDGSDDHGAIPPDALLRRAGIAAGLGAVRRFSHALWHEPFEGGKRVFSVRYVRGRAPLE